MRGRYDPIKRLAAFLKTNWRYSQKHTSVEGGEEGAGEDSAGEKGAIRSTRANS